MFQVYTVLIFHCVWCFRCWHCRWSMPSWRRTDTSSGCLTWLPRVTCSTWWTVYLLTTAAYTLHCCLPPPSCGLCISFRPRWSVGVLCVGWGGDVYCWDMNQSSSPWWRQQTDRPMVHSDRTGTGDGGGCTFGTWSNPTVQGDGNRQTDLWSIVTGLVQVMGKGGVPLGHEAIRQSKVTATDRQTYGP